DGVGGAIGALYQCNGTPMGYVIDAQGKIASEIGIGAQALLALAKAPGALGGANGAGARGSQRGVEGSKLRRDGLPAGAAAPPFRLPLLHGGALSLEAYRGRQVLLVFSDPQCGPCDQLAPRLERHARRAPA